MDKEALRERVWDALDDHGEARFPFPPHGRIPNFAGADAAADRLAGTDAWADAETVKVNPDAPQWPVRRRALADGKVLYVAVPRLRAERCFRRLDPDAVDDYDGATTIDGIAEAGAPVAPDGMDAVDLVVSGSVAATERGERVGKGEGYSDIEFALLREFGRVDGATPTATTVHELQVVDEDVPTEPHDVPMDLVVTPERVVRPPRGDKPVGIEWDALDDARVRQMPVLDRVRSAE